MVATAAGRFKSSFFGVFAMGLALTPSAVGAAPTLGTPDPTISYACDPSDPFMTLEFNSNFDIYLRNCSEGSAAALITLSYATPGGDRGSTEDYGIMELRVLFQGASGNEEVRVPVEGVAIGSGVILHVKAVGYRPNGGSFDQRVLGSPLYAMQSEPGPLPEGSGEEGLQETLALTPELRSMIERDLLMRAAVNPQATIPESRWGLEINQGVVDNRGGLTLNGILHTKVSCSESLLMAESCANPLNPEQATHSQQDIDALLSPFAFLSLRSREPNGNQFFDVCCDPFHTSRVVVQCSRMVVQEVFEGGSWKLLDQWVDVPWAKDIQVVEAGLTADDVAFSCEDFSSDPVPRDADSQTVKLVDRDNDGTHDPSDFLAPSEHDDGPAFTRVVLTHTIRGKTFTGGNTFTDFQNVARVSIGGVDAPSFELDEPLVNKLLITIPTALPAGEHTVRLCEKNNCNGMNDPAEALERLIVREHAYTPIQGLGYLLPVDSESGLLIDRHPSFQESAPVMPNTPVIAYPRAAQFTTEPGYENLEVVIAGGSEVFIYDDPNRVLKDFDPVAAGIQGREMATEVMNLALDPAGEFAFVLKSNGTIGAVQVQKAGILNEEDRFASYLNVADVGPADALDIQTHRLTRTDGTEQITLYITTSCVNCSYGVSEDCSMYGGASMVMGGTEGLCGIEVPDCEIVPLPGGGGGGQGHRTVTVAVRVLTPNRLPGSQLLDPSNPWTQNCETDLLLSDPEISGGQVAWSQVGLDMNAAGNEIFVANPETNSLFVIDTTTNTVVLDGSEMLRIEVGSEPFDVELMMVKNSSGQDVERAYVANHGDDTMSIVDVDPEVRATIGPARILFEDFNGLTELHVETMAGSGATKRLFLVSPNAQRVLPYRLVGQPGENIDGDHPFPGDPFVVGPLPRRISLQE